VCCGFTVYLTEDEVRGGRVAWDLHEPYKLPKHETTGCCKNLKSDGGCGVYADRPSQCRKYECSKDPRIWIDFENRVPAPMPFDVIPIGEWPDDDTAE
jgi:Fe-S-cluster containining protein